VAQLGSGSSLISGSSHVSGLQEQGVLKEVPPDLELGRHHGHPREVDPVAVCRPALAPVPLVYQVLQAGDLADHPCSLVVEDQGAPDFSGGVSEVQQFGKECRSPVRDSPASAVTPQVIVGTQRPALVESTACLSDNCADVRRPRSR
jgi:hypothetical protein